MICLWVAASFPLLQTAAGPGRAGAEVVAEDEEVENEEQFVITSCVSVESQSLTDTSHLDLLAAVMLGAPNFHLCFRQQPAREFL